MTMIGLSLRAHGQYSRINSIAFQNAGTPITGGYFTYPFTFNFVGCTGATSGSTLTLTCSTGGSGVTSIATTSPITGGPITTTGTIACPTCVVSSSPGAGLAHFAGSTQTVTSSAVSLTADVSGILPPANGGTGVANTATLTLGSSNQNWAALGTGIVKNTTTTGALTNASSSDILGLCTTCVVASSPGVGIAHFAGSTQTVTSSAVNLAGADVTGNLPAANVAAGTLATGMAAATGSQQAGGTNVATQAYADASARVQVWNSQTGLTSAVFGCGGIMTGTETSARCVASMTMTLSHCTGVVGTTQTSGNGLTWTIRKNGSTCATNGTISLAFVNVAGGTVVHDNTHSCTLAQDDLYDMASSVSGSPVSAFYSFSCQVN